jgi:hypothetical protein
MNHCALLALQVTASPIVVAATVLQPGNPKGGLQVFDARVLSLPPDLRLRSAYCDGKEPVQRHWQIAVSD